MSYHHTFQPYLPLAPVSVLTVTHRWAQILLLTSHYLSVGRPASVSTAPFTHRSPSLNTYSGLPNPLFPSPPLIQSP